MIPPVGMTILLCPQKLQREIPATELSSRPERKRSGGTCGSFPSTHTATPAHLSFADRRGLLRIFLFEMFRFLGYLFDRNMLQPRPYQAQRYDGHIGEDRQLDPGHRCRLHADAQNLGNARSLRITVREFPGCFRGYFVCPRPHETPIVAPRKPADSFSRFCGSSVFCKVR
jgi:hypothetical protein